MAEVPLVSATCPPLTITTTRCQAAVKKAEASTWAKKARTQKLFNAAHNDEITWSNIGHMHPSEMNELRKMSPEFKAIEKKHHITSATDMDYQPLRWMHEQGEPNAVKPHKAALKVKPARMQELWNAAADDEVGGSGFNNGDNSKGFSARQWLASQQDDAEMRETAPLPMPGFKRMFREDADHDRNYEGSYVSDNSIGLQVDNLKAPTQMLAMTDSKLQKSAEKEHAAARAAYLASHKRQAEIAKDHPLPEKAEVIEENEKQGLRELKKIDALTSRHASDSDDIEAVEKLQAKGRIAYLAKHERIADRATGGRVSKSKADAEGKDKAAAKTMATTTMNKARATTSLEGEDDAEAGDADGAEDENAAVKAELDDLKAMAMKAFGNLPDTAPASIRSIAKGDYHALMGYLDQVAADTTGLPHGAAVPAGEAEGGADEGAAQKAKPSALKGNVKFSSLHKFGGVEVALALDEAVRSPLSKVAAQLRDAENDAERSNIVLQGLAKARINALEIIDMPSAAQMAAKEDLISAEEANAKEAVLAKNEMKGVPRFTPPVDMVRAVPVEEVELVN